MMKRLIISILFIFSIGFIYGQRVVDANRVIVRDSITLNNETIKITGASNGQYLQRVFGRWVNGNGQYLDTCRIVNDTLQLSIYNDKKAMSKISLKSYLVGYADNLTVQGSGTVGIPFYADTTFLATVFHSNSVADTNRLDVWINDEEKIVNTPLINFTSDTTLNITNPSPYEVEIKADTLVLASIFHVNNVVQGAGTDLTYTASPDSGLIQSNTGNDATIDTVDYFNSGLMTPRDKWLMDSSLLVVSIDTGTQVEVKRMPAGDTLYFDENFGGAGTFDNRITVNLELQNLTYSPYPDKGIMNISGGTGDTIPVVTSVNAGLMLPTDKTKLDSIIYNDIIEDFDFASESSGLSYDIAHDPFNKERFAVLVDGFYSNTGYVLIGYAREDQISVGSPISIGENSDGAAIDFDKITPNKIAIAYTKNDWTGASRVGIVDGTNVSLGAEKVFDTSYLAGGFIKLQYDPFNTDKYVIYYTRATPETYAIVCTVSDTTISTGTKYSVSASNSMLMDMEFNDLVEDQVLFMYCTGSTGGSIKIGTLNGSVLSLGSAKVYSTNNLAFGGLDIDPFENDKLILVYRDATDGNKGKCKIGTISGSSLTFGSASTFTSNSIWACDVSYDNNIPKKACIIYAKNPTGFYSKVASTTNDYLTYTNDELIYGTYAAGGSVKLSSDYYLAGQYVAVSLHNHYTQIHLSSIYLHGLSYYWSKAEITKLDTLRWGNKIDSAYVLNQICNYNTQTLSTTSDTLIVANGVNGILDISGNTTIRIEPTATCNTGNITVICEAAADSITFTGGTMKINPDLDLSNGKIPVTNGAEAIDVYRWWYDGTRIIIDGNKNYE